MELIYRICFVFHAGGFDDRKGAVKRDDGVRNEVPDRRDRISIGSELTRYDRKVKAAVSGHHWVTAIRKRSIRRLQGQKYAARNEIQSCGDHRPSGR